MEIKIHELYIYDMCVVCGVLFLEIVGLGFQWTDKF